MAGGRTGERGAAKAFLSLLEAGKARTPAHTIGCCRLTFGNGDLDILLGSLLQHRVLENSNGRQIVGAESGLTG